MKTIICGVFATASIALTSCSSINLESERQKVQAMYAEINKAFENGDMTPAKRYIAEDFEMFITTEKGWNRVGRETFIEIFGQTVKPAGNVKNTVNDATWSVTPAMAWYKADEVWDLGLLKKPIKRHFLTIAIFEKRNDQWYMVHLHHSYIPPDSVKPGSNK